MSLKRIGHDISFNSVKVTLANKYLEHSSPVLPACAGPYAATISETDGEISIPCEMCGARHAQVPNQKATAESRRWTKSVPAKFLPTE